MPQQCSFLSRHLGSLKKAYFAADMYQQHLALMGVTTSQNILRHGSRPATLHSKCSRSLTCMDGNHDCEKGRKLVRFYAPRAPGRVTIP
ncbi:hypothetical protein RIF29_41116 [Crotalaria pallida]|uniref:Uncharacterized protein n=1 Tax=Crotalaria pallida TaxID=3830 RepID=A0AAN9HR81_CROPI